MDLLVISNTTNKEKSNSKVEEAPANRFASEINELMFERIKRFESYYLYNTKRHPGRKGRI